MLKEPNIKITNNPFYFNKLFFIRPVVGFLFIGLFIFTNSFAQYNIVDIPALRHEISNANQDSTKARLLAKLGWSLRFTNRAESEKLASEVIRLSEKKNDWVRLAEAYRIKGFYKIMDQDVLGCFNNYAIGLGYAKKAKSTYYQASLLNLTGGVYANKGDFDKALKLYEEGLKIAEDNHEPEMISQLLNNMAEVYSDAGRSIDFTLPFYQRALKYEIEISNWQYVAMIYSNIAKEYAMAGNKEEAEKAVRQAIDNLNKKNDGGYVFATVSADIGEMYLNMGNYSMAEKYLQTSYRILDRLEIKDNSLISLSALCRLYLAKNEIEKAASFATKLVMLAKLYKTKLFLRDGYKVLVEIAKKNKRPEEALLFYEQYKNWNDSLFNQSKEEGIAALENRMKSKQEELYFQYETALKSEENKALQKSNNYLRKQAIAALIVAALFLLGGILLNKGYANSRKRNEVLEKQKELIEKHSEEKDTLLREINHRVKNNLQVISSLLNLQANSITDATAIEALRDSYERVKAISLIQQQLYSIDNFTSVQPQEYITSLFVDLKLVYNAKNINLIYTTDMVKTELDMQSAVPFGLIVNEVFTNALKYAFVEKTAGTIWAEFIDESDKEYRLVIKDDGVGLPIGLDTENTTSLGLRIIKELTRQLRGSFEFSSEGGTRFELRFPHITDKKLSN